MARAPIVTAAAADPLLTDLTRALGAAGLSSTLDSARAITVFAPDNSAFNGFGAGNLNTLLASRSDLRRVLDYLVVNGRITPTELATGASLTTLLGSQIQPARKGTVYKINSARVVCGNIQTANATVYIIDKLIIPQ